MAIRNILLEDNPTLRCKSKEVAAFDKKLWTLLDDMGETMYKARGVGLAAPQVGILRRVVVIDIGGGRIELINPVIISRSGAVEEAEGCLSSPNEYGLVTRPQKVRVKAYDRLGSDYLIEGEDLLARALCHEIDHLDGVLFKDLAREMLEPEDEE